jgi:hypothetical protein
MLMGTDPHMQTVRSVMLTAASELEQMQKLTSEAQFQAIFATAINTPHYPMRDMA